MLGSLLELAAYGVGTSTALAALARRGIVRVDLGKIHSPAVREAAERFLQVGEKVISFSDDAAAGKFTPAKKEHHGKRRH